MDKGKKPSNGEEDDFLKILMMDYDKQYPKPMEAADQNILSGDSSSSSESSKGDSNSVTDETDDAEKDQSFSNFLALGSPSFAHDISSSASSNNDLMSIINPSQMAEQTPVAARSATRAARPVRGLRKAMPPDMLARLSRQDPKKARRIITNRMSAIRAKEKKKLYTYMLEHKLHTLQAEAATSNAHLALLQTETMGLNAENARLKEQTSMVIQQIHFQDSMNDGIRNEIQNLRMLTQMGTNTTHHPHQAMVFNNVNHHHNNNNSNNVGIGTEQFFPINNNNQNYHHHQVPNNYPYHQVEQIENGVEQMNIGQQQYQLPIFNQQELPAAALPIQPINPFSNYHHQDHDVQRDG